MTHSYTFDALGNRWSDTKTKSDGQSHMFGLTRWDCRDAPAASSNDDNESSKQNLPTVTYA
jgi:hypothetical protein